MERIKAGEKGVVLLLAKKEFKDSNKNNRVASAIQEWFFKKKLLILAFKLLKSEKNKNVNCQASNGVFWFKSEKKCKIFDGEHKFILFCYNKNIIAFARLKNAQLSDNPIMLNNNPKDVYNGYFVVSNIVIFKDIVNEDTINVYFKKSRKSQKNGYKISLRLQNYTNIQCQEVFNVGEKISQDIIDDAKELSEHDKWKSLKDTPEWFKNIEEFCKF